MYRSFELLYLTTFKKMYRNALIEINRIALEAPISRPRSRLRSIELNFDSDSENVCLIRTETVDGPEGSSRVVSPP